MVWTQIIVIDETAYPLNVAQKAAYALAATVSILITCQDSFLHLAVTPADLRINVPHLSEAQARAMTTRPMNDFLLHKAQSAGMTKSLIKRIWILLKGKTTKIIIIASAGTNSENTLH